MTHGWIIDTNHVSLAIRGDAAVRRRLLAHHRGTVRLTVITLAELEYATLRHPDPDRWDAAWRGLVRTWPVLSFHRDEAVEHARIRDELRSRPIGERDLIIAAIARTHGLTVVTHNTGEFKRVKGLKVEDWAG